MTRVRCFILVGSAHFLYTDMQIVEMNVGLVFAGGRLSDARLTLLASGKHCGSQMSKVPGSIIPLKHMADRFPT